MSKHTQGEWEVANGGRAVFAGEKIIAAVYGDSADCSPDEAMQERAKLIAAAPALLEACNTFHEWLRREEEGFVKAGRDRSTPEGEAAWREWYYENLRLCGLAQDQAYAAIAKATE